MLQSFLSGSRERDGWGAASGSCRTGRAPVDSRFRRRHNLPGGESPPRNYWSPASGPSARGSSVGPSRGGFGNPSMHGQGGVPLSIFARIDSVMTRPQPVRCGKSRPGCWNPPGRGAPQDGRSQATNFPRWGIRPDDRPALSLAFGNNLEPGSRSSLMRPIDWPSSSTT
jgi:hypothetical protein